MVARVEKSEWLSARQAAKLAAVDEHKPAKWAEAGLVRTLALPGCNTRFNRHDIERLVSAALSGRPATEDGERAD